MERASMNVRATKDSLLRFLTSELNYIDIHLCSDDFSLGAALLDYSSQLNRAFHYHNFDNEPLVFHDTFEIKPSGATGGRSGAKVKCAVSVRRDHLPMTPAESPIKPVPSPAASKLPTPKISTEDYDTDHGIDELPFRDWHFETLEVFLRKTTNEDGSWLIFADVLYWFFAKFK